MLTVLLTKVFWDHISGNRVVEKNDVNISQLRGLQKSMNPRESDLSPGSIAREPLA